MNLFKYINTKRNQRQRKYNLQTQKQLKTVKTEDVS